MNRRRGEVRAQAALLAACLGLAGAPALAAGASESPEPPCAEARNEECLDCHADFGSDEPMKFPDGSTLEIGVDPEVWAGSVHARELSCRDCHTTIVADPHPRLGAASAREYQVAASKTCRRCHYAFHTRLVDSVHFAELEKGNLDAPTCADCHGAHDVADAGAAAIVVEQRCARCHQEIAVEYERSVHALQLTAAGKDDVPVCTDCHGVHAMGDPRKAGFHARSHEICVRCHSDPVRMAPYGLDTDVVSTYLDDFHGVSNTIYAESGVEARREMATCIDCHGAHDVQRLAGPGADPDEVRARIVQRCRECHEDVGDSFAGAWLSHYRPTLESAPLVWGITWAYRILIPFILLGLIIHILLDLWRIRFQPKEVT